MSICLHCYNPATWQCLECKEDVCTEHEREHQQTHMEPDPDDASLPWEDDDE